jgi:hypothetical protein
MLVNLRLMHIQKLVLYSIEQNKNINQIFIIEKFLLKYYLKNFVELILLQHQYNPNP